jgi:hypothetical protein
MNGIFVIWAEHVLDEHPNSALGFASRGSKNTIGSSPALRLAASKKAPCVGLQLSHQSGKVQSYPEKKYTNLT